MKNTLSIMLLLFFSVAALGCRGECTTTKRGGTANTLSFAFSGCSKGASIRNVSCTRAGATAEFDCSCTANGKAGKTFRATGAAPGVMSNVSITDETLFKGCDWSDLAPHQ